MFPTATNPVPPAESSWVSTALSKLSEGLGEVYDPSMGSGHVPLELADSSTLSQSIAEQMENEDEQEVHLKAQNSHQAELDDAQERRTEKNRHEVSDAKPGRISKDSGKVSREANSAVRPPVGPAGRLRGESSPMRQGTAVETVSSSGRQTGTSSRSVQTSQLITPPVMRGVPAAVLRAVEVEANIQAGSRNVALLRSGHNSTSHASTGIKSMGEAEIRTLQGMTALMAQRGGRMRVQLNPLQLGSITIDIKVEGNRVDASIEAATKAAVKVLEASTSRLRLSLESQGYNLERIEIKHESQSSGSTDDSGPENESEGSRSDETESDGSGRRNRTSGRHHASNEEFNLIEQSEQEIDQ